MDYIKKLSTSLIEDLSKFKLDYKYLKYHVADFQEKKRRASNITLDNFSINAQGGCRGSSGT